MVSHGNKGRSKRSIPRLSTVALQTIDYKLSSFFDFGACGEAAEAEADGCVGLGGSEAKGTQNVGGFGDARGAGGAGECNESAQIERRMPPYKLFYCIISEDESNGLH